MTRIWGAVEALTGTVSVALILVIGLILVAFAIVYLVAACIVLLRFAQSAESLGLILLCAGSVCPAYALLWLQVLDPQLELAPWAVWIGSFAKLTAGLYLACAVVLPIGLAALRRGIPGIIGVAGLAALMGVLVSFLLGRLDAASPFEAMGLGLGALVGLALFPLAAAGLLEIRRGAEWFIAIRYLTAERRQVFISAITLICVGAVAAGVWLIITVLSVMNGFERTWREEIVGNYAHFLVRSYYGEVVGYEALLQEIESVEGVVAASPYIDAEGMIRGADGVIAPVRLHGIDPVRAVRVTRFAERMIDGQIDDLLQAEANGDAASPGLLVGDRMAEKLGLSVGDEMIVISPEGGPPSPLGISPRLVRFVVLGTFESSFLPFDDFSVYGSLAAVQDFLGTGDVVAGFKVRSGDFYRSRRVADSVEAKLGHPFYGRDWKELFPAFFHALNDNRSLMFMLLVMIMVVSAFVIVVTLMMMIMAKSTDVAILKTMGARDRSIELVFAIEGTLIGVAGVALGVLAGMAVSTQLAWIQARIEEVTGVDTLPASVYQFSTLPTEVDLVQVFSVVAIALILSLGATLLPSRHGARLDPVEALREE